MKATRGVTGLSCTRNSERKFEQIEKIEINLMLSNDLHAYIECLVSAVLHFVHRLLSNGAKRDNPIFQISEITTWEIQ